ncbi:hypothetical protein [Microbispora bryophytorum]|uniref:hypothetical protein n=1 Tax=Microbispora bryophytorum TaxID=1460882 RepID=UPI0033EAEC38
MIAPIRGLEHADQGDDRIPQRFGECLGPDPGRVTQPASSSAGGRMTNSAVIFPLPSITHTA